MSTQIRLFISLSQQIMEFITRVSRDKTPPSPNQPRPLKNMQILISYFPTFIHPLNAIDQWIARYSNT